MSTKRMFLTIFCVGMFAVGVLTLIMMCVGVTENFNIVQIVGTYYFGLGIAGVIVGGAISVIRNRYRDYQWNQIEKRVKR